MYAKHKLISFVLHAMHACAKSVCVLQSARDKHWHKPLVLYWHQYVGLRIQMN